jgi:hypothetical protein
MAVRQYVDLAALSKGQFTVDASSSIIIDPTIKFKTPYSLARIDKGTSFKVKYLIERWQWFNRECFGSEMTLPVIVCTEKAKNPKTLGWWLGTKRTLNIAYKMMALPTDQQALGVLLHEMCHQYEEEILKPPRAEFLLNKRHGPHWVSTMRSVGMPPDITFVGDAEVLLDQAQKDNLVKKRKNEIQPSEDMLLVRHSSDLSPKHFNRDGFMYVLQVSRNGDLSPAIVVEALQHTDGAIGNDPSYFGYTKSDIAKGTYSVGFRLSKLIKPTPTQLKKFPKDFFSIPTLKRILNLLGRNNGNTIAKPTRLA